MTDFQAVALVPAAGEGRRMGPGVNKIFRMLKDRPILVATIQALYRAPEIQAVFLVVPPGEEDVFRASLAEYDLRVEEIVSGGRERQDSVRNGLTALERWKGWQVEPDKRIVAIHDAARPLVEPEIIGTAVKTALELGAAGIGVRAKDTMKVTTADGFVRCTPPRDRMWAVQTPQAFRLPLILRAHRVALQEGWTGTDDCALVERLGAPVKIVEGSYRNIKITTPEDLVVADALMGSQTRQRIGQGFDVHRLAPGRRLVLGGVEIPWESGLLGHSDADVLIHAVMDALLGAAGLGDIGGIFPDTDPRFEGADSCLLLAEVVGKIYEAGYRVANVDATVIAQRPKLAPHIPLMRKKLAEILGLTTETVNIKATTTEGLGFAGRGEGIAAMAVALLYSV